MKKKPRYRFYVWMMIFSGVVLASTIVITSLQIIREGRRFHELVLDENKTLMINTLRFGHGVMMHMGTQSFASLIDLALRSEFIRYVGILDTKGKLIAQSTPLKELPLSERLHPGQLSDSKILESAEGLLLISYKAEEIKIDEDHKKHHATFMGHKKDLPKPGWFLVGLDISRFRKHHRDMVVQTVGAGGVIFLFGILIIIFFGIVERYELAHMSIERLQKIRRILANFVPATARNIIEKTPEMETLDKYIQDATVLFLDIERFSSLVQEHPVEKLNRTIESYFSSFLNSIQKYDGDINETAGDGMMVIFLHPVSTQHARNAVQAALEIQKRCIALPKEENAELIPIKVNVGVSSGEVYLGSTKMRGAEGDRWTFTASGSVTILAARLSDYAEGGQILIGEETARRLDVHFTLSPLGRIPLKNVRDSGEVYLVPNS